LGKSIYLKNLKRYRIFLDHLDVSSLTPHQSAGFYPPYLIFIVLFKLIEGPSYGLISTSLAASLPADSQSPFKYALYVFSNKSSKRGSTFFLSSKKSLSVLISYHVVVLPELSFENKSFLSLSLIAFFSFIGLSLIGSSTGSISSV